MAAQIHQNKKELQKLKDALAAKDNELAAEKLKIQMMKL